MLKYPNKPNNYRNYNFDMGKMKSSQINYANRGLSLEDHINEANKFYLDRGIAVVHKKPTPIQIVKVDYIKRSSAVIREAYYNTASTTDYNGVYKGIHLDFEAKETKQKSFPLNNLHVHQVEHMNSVQMQGGLVFLLLNFVQFDEVYFLPFEKLLFFWQRMISGGRKSITHDEVKQEGFLISLRYNPVIDYICVVDKLVTRKG